MIRPDDELWGRLKARADAMGRPVAWLALQLVREGLGEAAAALAPVDDEPRRPAVARVLRDAEARVGVEPSRIGSSTHLPCGHSKVLLRGGLCRGCNPMVPG